MRAPHRCTRCGAELPARAKIAASLRRHLEAAQQEADRARAFNRLETAATMAADHLEGVCWDHRINDERDAMNIETRTTQGRARHLEGRS